MITIFIISNLLIACARANISNNLIVDYFAHKKVPAVVGFSCNNLEDDIKLTKYINEFGMNVALHKLTLSTRMNLEAKATYWKLGIFLNLQCYNVTSIISIFSKATNYQMFDELHYWLILGLNLSKVLQLIDDQAFGFSTDFVIAVPSNEDAYDYELYDTYNFAKHRGGKLNVTFLGRWNQERGIDIKMKQTKFSRRSNLHGLSLRATFYKAVYKNADTPLEEYLQDYSQFPKEGLSRFGFTIITHLSELFNFQLISLETPEWDPADKIGPIVRSMNDSSADITGSPLTMQMNRTYWVKYVHQSWPFRTCFMFRNPQPMDIKIYEILRPFVDEVWCIMSILMVISMLILTFISRWDWNESYQMRLSNSFLLVFGAICQQCTDVYMKFISTRIAFLSIMIFGELLYNYYSAGVVSARLNEPIYKINDSLNQLTKLPLKFSSEYMIYFNFFLKRPDWEIQQFLKKRWQFIPESEHYKNPEEAMRLVKEGGYAYHTHPDVGYPFVDRYFKNHEVCELMEVHLARPTLSTFAVTMNSTIVEMARVGLTKIAEVGLRHRQVHRWHYRKPTCQKSILSATSVNIYEFAPHLLILLVGLILAIIINIIENIIARKKVEFHMRSAHLLFRKNL